MNSAWGGDGVGQSHIARNDRAGFVGKCSLAKVLGFFNSVLNLILMPPGVQNAIFG